MATYRMLPLNSCRKLHPLSLRRPFSLPFGAKGVGEYPVFHHTAITTPSTTRLVLRVDRLPVDQEMTPCSLYQKNEQEESCNPRMAGSLPGKNRIAFLKVTLFGLKTMSSGKWMYRKTSWRDFRMMR
jgi:hypothetical protein